MRSRLGVLCAIFIGLLLISAVPALADIRIERIRFDPPGDDDGSNASLNREVIREREHRAGGRETAWVDDPHRRTSRLQLSRSGSLGERRHDHSGEGDATRRHLVLEPD